MMRTRRRTIMPTENTMKEAVPACQLDSGVRMPRVKLAVEVNRSSGPRIKTMHQSAIAKRMKYSPRRKLVKLLCMVNPYPRVNLIALFNPQSPAAFSPVRQDPIHDELNSNERGHQTRHA